MVRLRSLQSKFIVAVGGVFLLSILVLSTSVLLSVNAQVRNQLQENVQHNLEGFYSLLRIYEQESLARAQRFAERDTLIEAMRSGGMDRGGASSCSSASSAGSSIKNKHAGG